MNDRALFATKIGVIASTVGSAVGLGNLWRFPYVVGTNGGGAFLLTYLFCILLLGLPLMMSEFMVGRKGRCNASVAFSSLSSDKRWNVIGYLGIAASIIILGYYMVVSGWVVDYLYQSIGNDFVGKTGEEIKGDFVDFQSNPFKPLMWVAAFLVANYIILVRGVTKGIEKASNILMPLLFIILIVFSVYALTMPGAKKGLEFIFKPDFSMITGKVFLAALGQAFFSLSIGIGILITFGSYFKNNSNLLATSFTVAMLDIVVALLAGVIIFPVIFSFGDAPTQGPELIFVTIPSLMQHMGFPHFWSILFFTLVAVAALTSTISLCEVAISFINEKFSLNRKQATRILLSLVAILATLSSLSFSTLSEFKMFDMTFFSFSDYISANILLPLGGLLLSIFIGWRVDKNLLLHEFSLNSKLPKGLFKGIIFVIKYLAPILISLIFLSQLGIFN